MRDVRVIDGETIAVPSPLPKTSATCKTCRWWDRYGSGECGRVDDTEEFSPVVTPMTFTMAVSVSDDSGLSLKLVTGPDFGCLLHTPKG